MRRMNICLALMIALASVLATGPAFAQAPVPLKDRAQFRDAVIDAGSGRAYVAAYDRNAIWVIDLATGAKIAEVAVGKGPAALAQDGWVLA